MKVSIGRPILMSLYPRRSPNPPATRTKPQCVSSSKPSFSNSWNSLELNSTSTTGGTYDSLAQEEQYRRSPSIKRIHPFRRLLQQISALGQVHFQTARIGRVESTNLVNELHSVYSVTRIHEDDSPQYAAPR